MIETKLSLCDEPAAENRSFDIGGGASGRRSGENAPAAGSSSDSERRWEFRLGSLRVIRQVFRAVKLKPDERPPSAGDVGFSPFLRPNQSLEPTPPAVTAAAGAPAAPASGVAHL